MQVESPRVLIVGGLHSSFVLKFYCFTISKRPLVTSFLSANNT